MTERELGILATKARLLLFDAIYRAQSGHPGGSLSCVDALTALYFDEMHIEPGDPKKPKRDRLVLSKGHAAPALYAVLALRGYFPEENLKQLRSIRSHLSGHPDMRYVPGVDMSTGSLGQGFSAAVGMAIGAKMKHEGFRTYCILGDGELEEGQVWEAVMAAAKWRLSNLCCLVDVNGLQIDGRTEDVMPTSPLDKKFEAFNWNVIHADGHDFESLKDALKAAQRVTDKPTAILMKTVKGRGISYMEKSAAWHGKAPNDTQYRLAVNELNAHLAGLEAE